MRRLVASIKHAIFGHGYGPCKDGKARCLHCGWVIQLYEPQYDLIPEGFDKDGLPVRFRKEERLP